MSLKASKQGNAQIFKLLLEGVCSKKIIAKMFVVFSIFLTKPTKQKKCEFPVKALFGNKHTRRLNLINPVL